MIRSFHAADLLTLANGCCGMGAIFRAVAVARGQADGGLLAAGGLIVAALVFDVLDGRVARWRHQASALGREMDSLADVVSFGVAPAVIAFVAGLDSPIDAVCLVFFAVCGLSRLARYNVTAEALLRTGGQVHYFEGTPIPTSLVPLGLLLFAHQHGTLLPVAPFGIKLHLPSLLFVLSGSLMISTIRVPKP